MLLCAVQCLSVQFDAVHLVVHCAVDCSAVNIVVQCCAVEGIYMCRRGLCSTPKYEAQCSMHNQLTIHLVTVQYT